MPALTYLPLTETDQPKLHELMQRIYPPVYAYLWPDGGTWYVDTQFGPQNFTTELAVPTADYRFIMHDGQTVGIVRTVTDTASPDHPDRRALKLHRLYLDPAVHGHGLGKTVMHWVLDSARHTHHDLVWLEAMDSAPQAVHFYARMGFHHSADFTLNMPRMYPRFRGMYRMTCPTAARSPSILPA